MTIEELWRKHKQDLAAAAVLAAVLAGFVWTNKNQVRQSADIYASAQAGSVSYIGIEGKTALELLKANHRVETKNYAGLGEFVTGIDGKMADHKHFWAFYANGKMAQEGAGAYLTRDGEFIEWKLEEIK